MGKEMTELELVQLEQAKMALELTKRQVQEFKDKEFDDARKREVRAEAIVKERQEIANLRSICKHKTGGRGKKGFFSGDGSHGYCVTTQQLPTKEIYFMCFRCQKEWHMPKKGDVVSGVLTMEQYRKQVAEYNEVAQWDKPYFDGGEICASVLFNIPALDRKELQDAEAFAQLEK